MKIAEILEICEQIAPFCTAEDYDNVGLLAGSPEMDVNAALLSLDLTMDTIDEAERAGASLIITHHPILFHARKNLREDDPEGALLCRLIRSGRALIAMHTNFDKAQGGVNDALCEALGLSEAGHIGEFLCAGLLPREMTAAEFAAWAGEKLHAVVRPYVPMGYAKPIRRVAVCGGAGGEFWEEAAAFGADAFLTGEIRHHEMLAAMQQGLPLFEAGHYETEQIAISSLANRLQKEANAIQYKLRIIESQARPFAPR